ncbi:3-hydroxyacyl-ACP dehydratase FabZ [Marinicrinis sediminis]|uniref:3-hydroxyacyl-ACP dehydratase FabZ n=1 Tax=Marinicrinis sediminis TaxID=1652465 RepID=A0ABW5R6Y3_9BACL
MSHLHQEELERAASQPPEEEGMEELDVLSVLPHRYPFVMVDRITARQSGKWVKGLKNVTHNEWFFQGHFPDKPVMPGVLITEAIAQLGAFVFAEDDPHAGKGQIGMIASIKEIKFMQPVVPGHQLELYFEVIQARGPYLKGKGEASVRGKTVASIQELIIFRSKGED